MDKRYTCAEVADMYRVKVLTVWEWVRTGKLHAVKIGKRYLIRPEDLEEFEGKKSAKERAERENESKTA